jgi:hypothetical protein
MNVQNALIKYTLIQIKTKLWKLLFKYEDYEIGCKEEQHKRIQEDRFDRYCYKLAVDLALCRENQRQ